MKHLYGSAVNNEDQKLNVDNNCGGNSASGSAVKGNTEKPRILAQLSRIVREPYALLHN